jgi:hypothetical protein
VVSLALLAACAYTEERFRADADAAVCAWKAECYGYEGAEACEEAAAATWDLAPAGCSYDEDEARDCARDLEKMSCDDEAFPLACGSVWICG